MGLYDEYGENKIQLKVGNYYLREFKIGDTVDSDIADGVYVGYNGVIVIVGNHYVADFQDLFDFMGHRIPIDILQML